MRINKYKCPACNGDGKETCSNPDHGFYGMVGFHDVGRIGCPCCGHDEDHKIRHYRNGKWQQDKCFECNGMGYVSQTECDRILDEYSIDSPTDDFLIFKDLFMFGDAIEKMKEIPSKTCSLIKVDLPYGTTQNSWDVILDFKLLWKQWNRIKTDEGVIILYSAGKFTPLAIMSNFEDYKYDLIWQKTNAKGHLNVKKQPLRGHENILVFYSKRGTYNPQKTTGHKRKISTAEHKRNCKITSNYGDHGLTSYDSTERYPTSVLTFKSDTQKSKIHPTQKPLELDQWLILTYSNEGDIVMDCTAGSGTTAVACLNTKRHFICIENDLEMYEKALDRINSLEL